MLNEEEKAIKKIQEFRDYYAREDIHRENYSSDENYQKSLNELRALKKQFDIVLNLITKLQKENEHLQKENKKLNEELNKENNRCMILANNDKFKEQVIDLMAEVMFNSNKPQLLIEYGIENKEQIIKDFEQLAKEKGE